MKRRTAIVLLTGLMVVSFAVTTATLVRASNQWYCWHWPGPSVGFGSAASGYWSNILNSEANQWSSGTCMNLGGGSDITGDADFYGGTGWLGLARILESGPDCTIVRAEALMNQSYLDGPSYDETDDRHVACQEIGHTIGLDHRKGPNSQTCMNDQFLGFPDFDQHDADTVAAITPGCGGGGGGCANGGENGRKKCTDGIDNDGDGCTDGADPDCQ